jgi:hypothetical protein
MRWGAARQGQPRGHNDKPLGSAARDDSFRPLVCAEPSAVTPDARTILWQYSVKGTAGQEPLGCAPTRSGPRGRRYRFEALGVALRCIAPSSELDDQRQRGEQRTERSRAAASRHKERRRLVGAARPLTGEAAVLSGSSETAGSSPKRSRVRDVPVGTAFDGPSVLRPSCGAFRGLQKRQRGARWKDAHREKSDQAREAHNRASLPSVDVQPTVTVVRIQGWTLLTPTAQDSINLCSP